MEADMKKCPACAEEIKKEAKKCRYCGENFEENTNKEKINKKNWFSKHPIISFVLFLFVLGNIASGIFGVSNSTSEDYTENTTIKKDLDKTILTTGDCTDLMKETIVNQFKSPSTVKFIDCMWTTDKEYVKNKGDMIIMGEADSQNGFGAIVRSIFKCEITPTNSSCDIKTQ